MDWQDLIKEEARLDKLLDVIAKRKSVSEQGKWYKIIHCPNNNYSPYKRICLLCGEDIGYAVYDIVTKVTHELKHIIYI